MEVIQELEAEHAEAPHLRILQKSLAEELTIWVHSEEDFESVMEVSELLFNKKVNHDFLMKINEKSLATVAEEIPSFKVAKADLEAGVNIVELIVNGGVVNSNSDARRAIKGNALAVNKQKVASHEVIVKADELLHGKYMMIDNGKKHKFMLIAE